MGQERTVPLVPFPFKSCFLIPTLALKSFPKSMKVLKRRLIKCWADVILFFVWQIYKLPSWCLSEKNAFIPSIHYNLFCWCDCRPNVCCLRLNQAFYLIINCCCRYISLLKPRFSQSWSVSPYQNQIRLGYWILIRGTSYVRAYPFLLGWSFFFFFFIN